MDPKRGTLAIIVFLALLVAAWLLLAQGLLSLELFKTSASIPEQPEESAPVVLAHINEGEMHTYTGSVRLPTPCHTLASSVTVEGGAARKARIALTTGEPQGTLCAQVIDSQPFTVSFTSREFPTVTLALNGEEVPVEVTEEQ
jgi:hypothetical protein